ncbi:hypothetical protein OIE52_24260 [Streptomyces canus]|uniref:hypothetical protein n=1 Tax=Streptomyces canus TaxID=58343 RepID=UPI0032477EBD
MAVSDWLVPSCRFGVLTSAGMSAVLAQAPDEDFTDGGCAVQLPMLGDFSSLARSLPFSRPANWSWRDEQQQVFAQHREE